VTPTDRLTPSANRAERLRYGSTTADTALARAIPAATRCWLVRDARPLSWPASAPARTHVSGLGLLKEVRSRPAAKLRLSTTIPLQPTGARDRSITARSKRAQRRRPKTLCSQSSLPSWRAPDRRVAPALRHTLRTPRERNTTARAQARPVRRATVAEAEIAEQPYAGCAAQTRQRACVLPKPTASDTHLNQRRRAHRALCGHVRQRDRIHIEPAKSSLGMRPADPKEHALCGPPPSISRAS